MTDHDTGDYYVEIEFEVSGCVCKGHCSGNNTDDATPVNKTSTNVFKVNSKYIEDNINSEDDSLCQLALSKYTTEMKECMGSGFCSSGIKVRRQAVKGKLVEKKKKTLKKQYLDMCARKEK